MDKQHQKPNQEQKNDAKDLLRDLALGGTIGAVTKTIMAPVERVKLLMQTNRSNPDVLSGKEKRYKNPWDCITTVYKKQGLKSFWRGNLVNCLRYAPQQGSALAFNDFLNKSFPKYDSKKHFWKSAAVNLTSGGVAGAIANTICYPFDYARTRLASDVHSGKPRFNGIWDCIATTVRNQGITGLYTGWAVTTMGAFVYRAGQLGLFKQIQDMNPYKDDKGATGAVSSFAAVTLARTAILPFNYPFDTLRRIVMLQSEMPKSQRTYKGAWDCFKKVVKADGPRGLYHGFLPEIVRGVGGSLVVVAYDRIHAIFNL